MERYVRCSYSGKYQSPCLQTFFVAPPASGKSGLSLIRLLVEPIHDKIRQQVDEEMKAYRKEKKNYELLGKERVNTEAPQMPPNKMFLISGKISWTPTEQDSSAKPKRTPSPPPSVPNTVIGATRSAKPSTMTDCPTTDVPIRNIGK